MKTLKELLGLQDPDMLYEASAPVELKAVIDAFPKHHPAALAKLWGGKRLVWHGERFFDDDELGPAYIKAEAAAEEYCRDGYNTDANMDLHGEVDGEEVNGSMTWDVQFDDEKQECYLGYDPKKDKLYIGFDAWASDEDFNEAFEKEFKDMIGDDHDMDNDEHNKIYTEAWNEYQHGGFGFWGLVFEISHNGSSYEAEEALPPMQGGFYRGSYKLFKQQHPSVVDLRLD
jgi:hypothetical protein